MLTRQLNEKRSTKSSPGRCPEFHRISMILQWVPADGDALIETPVRISQP
jgi:hypothetical protein